MSRSIPPAADEHEEPEWLKVKGTVKFSPLPATTIPVLDATVPVATLAATLSSGTDPSAFHAPNIVVPDGAREGVVISPLDPSPPDLVGVQIEAATLSPAIAQNNVFPTITPVATLDADPRMAVSSDSAVLAGKDADVQQAEGVAPDRAESPTLSVSAPPIAVELPEEPPSEDDPPLPGGPHLDPGPVTVLDEFDVTPISDSNAVANAVNENAAIGTTVGITAFASDGDATQSGITYALSDNAG
ncbi:MAG: hypothetical protein K2X45_16760, partial [Phreatobacter sp.]|nr:hypothetical protein [Phreatobacter sp.]